MKQWLVRMEKLFLNSRGGQRLFKTYLHQCCGAGAGAGAGGAEISAPAQQFRSRNYLFCYDFSHFTILLSIWRIPEYEYKLTSNHRS